MEKKCKWKLSQMQLFCLVMQHPSTDLWAPADKAAANLAVAEIENHKIDLVLTISL